MTFKTILIHIIFFSIFLFPKKPFLLEKKLSFLKKLLFLTVYMLNLTMLMITNTRKFIPFLEEKKI